MGGLELDLAPDHCLRKEAVGQRGRKEAVGQRAEARRVGRQPGKQSMQEAWPS